jgi:hypothetical protein
MSTQVVIDQDGLATYGKDVFLYHGLINRVGFDLIADCLEKRTPRSDQVCLVLSSTGGEADSAYRISRAFRRYYKKFNLLIPGLCKSAATLLAIGADQLIFGNRGELGPLDIQMSKPDEMFESMSGLDIAQAINAIETCALSAFKRYLVDIKEGSGIRTRMAAEIAVELAEKCITPISSKIDPITLGEHQRAMKVAIEYGQRLNGHSDNLADGALEKLVSAYPSHGFVIDREESRSLFKNIEDPCGFAETIHFWAREIITGTEMSSIPLVMDLKSDLEKAKENIPEEVHGKICDGVKVADGYDHIGVGHENGRKSGQDGIKVKKVEAGAEEN